MISVRHSDNTDNARSPKRPAPRWKSVTSELLCAVASLFFLYLSAREVIHKGPFVRGATIVSRTGLSPRSSEDSLLLLAEASRTIPKGAGVAFVNPTDRSKDWLHYAVAVGQMPQHVIVYFTEGTSDPAIQFVITAAEMDNSQYVLWRELPHGKVYRRQ
jgi:hypothetical protein